MQTILQSGLSQAESIKFISRSANEAQPTNDHLTIDPATQSFIDILREIHSQILNLYQRSLSSPSIESAPPVCFSDHIVRLAKLFSDIYAIGDLDGLVLRANIFGEKPVCKNSADRRYPPRGEIARWAMRAFTPYFEDEGVLPFSYRLNVIVTLSQVMGSIGFPRKRAILLYELFRLMVPKLIQARVLGAAEWGMHPSAALNLASQGYGDCNIPDLMKSIIAVFGANFSTLNEGTECGWLELKAEVIRQCLTVCEALPHPAGLARFTSLLLSIPGTFIEKEEQIRLAGNLPRATSRARKKGLLVEAEYWDPFVVQKIELDRWLCGFPL